MSERVRAQPAWVVAVLAGMASYLDAGALVTTGVALSALYVEDLGLTPSVIGVLLGLQTLAFALGAACGGRLGDRFGRRRVLTSSLALYAAGIALLGAATAVDLLVVGVLLTGLAIGADLPVSLALLAEEAPKGRKGRLVAASQVFWSAGILVCAALAGLLSRLGALGGRLMFAHLLVVAVAVLALRLTLRESAEWLEARQAAGRSPSETAARTNGQARQLLRPPVRTAVLATGSYYAAWNLGANTLGQFGPFLWVHVAAGPVEWASSFGLVGVPLALAGTAVLLQVVESGARRRWWFLVGTVLTLSAWTVPLVLGPTPLALVVLSVLFAGGAALSGEVLYKVWAQELVPTLLRTTATGVTMALARLLAAVFAFATPPLALAAPDALFGGLLVLAVLAAVIGTCWVPRLPLASPALAPPLTGRADRRAA